MNISELIAAFEVELEQEEKRRDRCIAEVQTILNKARSEGRASLTADEDGDVEAAYQRKEKSLVDIAGIQKKLSQAKRAKDDEDQIQLGLAQRAAEPQPVGRVAAYDQVARVGQEARTYNPGNSRNGGAFLRDVVSQYVHRDLQAEQRLLRHMQEERVERQGKASDTRAADAGTAQFTGLVVPQYLTELYAPKVAAMRPLADLANKHDLPPDGMTVNISQITTGSSVDLQATEFAEVAGVAMDDTLLTENVQTAAGYQDLSRQAIDRGTGIEDVTMDDLFRRYASRLDFTILNQAVTGMSAVAQSNAVTAATLVGVLPKVSQGLAAAESVFLGFATPTLAVMHPRRWHWFNNLLGSTWPAISQPGVPTQTVGVNLAQEYGKGARGILPNGLVVIGDANVGITFGGGTEDEIYLVAPEEVHLWEDPSAPTFIRAEQPRAKNMAVTLVLYGYFAYSLRRYANGMQKLNGAALVTPVFTGS